MTLTKSQIVDSIQETTGFSRNNSVEVTETLLEIIKKTLASGDSVMISGFGKFTAKEKKARRERQDFNILMENPLGFYILRFS